MKNTLLILFTFLVLQINAQEVSQNILVEHYTNTRCGTCASKNPVLFNLLENYDEIHIAYYPSSPYSSCIFSMHNSSEADGRTNYYGIFGGTPRVVLNGEVVNAAATILQESRINAEVGNLTPFVLEATQSYINSDSVKVSIDLSTVANTTLSTLQLHVMLVENEISYAAPNGEDKHPNVFRKALFGLNGMTITPPANGMNETFEVNYAFDPDWVKEDLKIIVFLQDENDKSIKQSTQSSKLGNEDGTISAISNLGISNFNINPNPVYNSINLDKGILETTIYNAFGKIVQQNTVTNQKIDVQHLANGLYFLQYQKEGKIYIAKFLKN